MTTGSGAPAACRVCANTAGNVRYSVREMLLGTREPFDYVACAGCGCLQIESVPADLERHYPDAYFAFRRHDRLARRRWRRFVDRRRLEHGLGRSNVLGRAAGALSRPLPYVDWVRRAGVDRKARVLDVGCGGGKFLVMMSLGGFRSLTGVDPFVPGDIHYPGGVRIHRRDLAGFALAHPGAFDLVMFHHSLEHMPDPVAPLAAAERLLAPGGCVLVRIPVADSHAWEHFREHWVNLDAPRHLYLHTRESLGRVAAAAGLEVDQVVRDSTPSQFVGSLLYARDVPGNAPAREKAVFSRREMRAFRRRAAALNAEGRGDFAAFYLRRRAAPA